MPLVQPDVTGNTKTLNIELPTDLALRTRAYSEMAKARLDSVVRVALERLLQEDKTEFEAFLSANPSALDGRKLVQKARTPGASPKKAAASAPGSAAS
jgi:hypothetical protein